MTTKRLLSQFHEEFLCTLLYRIFIIKGLKIPTL